MRTTYRDCAVCLRGFQAEFEEAPEGGWLIQTICPECMELDQPDHYIQVAMSGGGTYTQKLSELGVVMEEIRTAAAEGDVGTTWTLTLVEMTHAQYEALGDFKGH